MTYPTEFYWDESGDTVLPDSFETRDVGTIFEFEPICGSDNVTIDLYYLLEHHTAPPIDRKVEVRGVNGGGKVFGTMPEFHAKTVTSQVALNSGDSVLIASWKPTGKPEYKAANVVHLVFVTGALVWKKPKEVP